VTYPLSHDHDFQRKYEELKEKYEGLKEVSTAPISRRKLTFQQNKILQFAAEHDSISSVDLSTKFPFSKRPIDYRNAKKDLRKLLDLNLLELNHKEKDSEYNKYKKQTKRFYKLSKYGVYNLISNNQYLLFEIVKNLLLNHSNHILFDFFLFPYIQRETLECEIDSSVFTEIFSYLYKCCKQVEELIFNIDHTSFQKDGYLTDHLFVWENIPEEEYDRESLRLFLRDKIGWNWVKKAEINKIENLEGITISYGLNKALIRLDKERRNAVLSFKGQKKYEFIVRSLAEDQFAVDVVLDEPLKYWHMKIFINYHIAAYMTKFIISLVPLYGIHLISPTLRVLGKDKKFTKMLKKIKYRFDRSFDLIVAKR
jgi:hypothetical protein